MIFLTILLSILLKAIGSLLFAIPAGFGLAAGFHLFKRMKNRKYLGDLEAQLESNSA